MKKNYIKLLNIIFAIAITNISSCDNDDTVKDEEVIQYTFEQKADLFIANVYSDLGIDLTLVKLETLQSGFIVAEDHEFFSPVYGPYYTAYSIEKYTPGGSLGNYMVDNDLLFSYPLTDNGDKTYSGYDGSGVFSTF